MSHVPMVYKKCITHSMFGIVFNGIDKLASPKSFCEHTLNVRVVICANWSVAENCDLTTYLNCFLLFVLLYLSSGIWSFVWTDDFEVMSHYSTLLVFTCLSSENIVLFLCVHDSMSFLNEKGYWILSSFSASYGSILVDAGSYWIDREKCIQLPSKPKIRKKSVESEVIFSQDVINMNVNR